MRKFLLAIRYPSLVIVLMLLFTHQNFAQTNWYVNDLYVPGSDHYTIGPGNDAFPGTSALPFATIQKAISVASAGDNIYVDAGTYTLASSIVVDKKLTFFGSLAGVDARTRASGSESIVDAANLTSYPGVVFEVQPAANESTIDGFTLQGSHGDQSNGCIWLEAGTNGTTIQNNIIQNNTVGMFLANNSASKQTAIKQNLFRNNTVAGPSSGNDIYADNSTAGSNLQNVLIKDNVFMNSSMVVDSWALGISNVGSIAFTNITFQGNQVSNHGRGIYFYATSNSTVTGNTFTGATNYAVGFFEDADEYPATIANSSFTITNNTFTSNSRGIYIVRFGAVEAYSGTLAPTGNIFTGGTYHLVNASTVHPSAIINAVGNTYDGVVLDGSTTLANIFAIADKVLDEVDVSEYGKVLLRTGNVYVTVNSYHSLETTTPDIQRGVDAAYSGDIVNVNSGTYTNQVEINKPLTLSGQGVGSTNIVSPNTLTKSFTTSGVNKPIIYVHDAAGVIIKNVTIDGAGKGNANNRFQGVAYRNAGGTVQDCEIKAIRNNPFDGIQAGVGIFAQADDGNARTLNITHNSIYDFQKNATSLSGANLTAVVNDNTITGAGPTNLIAQNGVQISFGATGSATGNTIGNINYPDNATALACGVLIYQATGSVTVSTNAVNNCQTAIAMLEGSGSVTNNRIEMVEANMGATSNWIAVLVEKGTFSVTANTIKGGSTTKADAINPAAEDGETTNITATNDSIDNCLDGILIQNFGTTGVVNGQYHDNSITNSALAINNTSSILQNATCNWYGTTDPAVVASKISGPVTYSPFLTNGTDNNPPAPGFVPVPGSCGGQAEYYVDDDQNTGDVYTSTATGNDANPGTAAAPFRTINHAIAVASAGDKIFVDAGTYNENVVISKSLTIQGAGNTTIVTLSSTCSGNGNGITINANNTTVKDLKVTNYSNGVVVAASTVELNNVESVSNCTTGIELGNGISGLTVKNSRINNNTSNGLRAGTGAQMNNITIDNCEVKGNAFGTAIFASSGGSNSFDNISIKNSDFGNNTQKGMYFEKLSNAVIENILMTNSGTDPANNTNAGIDINLKYGSYSNITIKNSEFTNCGVFGAATDATAPVVITIKARDDAPSYNTVPATLTNVQVLNNKINGPQNGLRFGEFGKTNNTPTDVHVHENDLSGPFANKAIINNTPSNTDATCNWYGTTDPSIAGSKLSGPVTYIPFLTNGTDNQPAVRGFQPVPGSCNGSFSCESPAHQAYTSNTTSGNQAYRGELGMEFIVNNASGILVKQLGAFDDGGNGITGLQTGGVRVAIFNRNTHTIVPGLNVVITGNGDHYTGNHRTVDITPVNLPPGDYVIVAKGYHAGEQNGNSGIGGLTYPTGDDGGGAITFGNQTSYGPDDPNGFTYPNTEADLGTTHRFLAGTLVFTTTVPCGGLSNNANLSNLVLSQGTLAPPFTPSTTSYTASVPNSTTSITVTPTAQDANATITVNGTPVASGTPSNPIPLVVGNNIINVVVTAQDGTTTKTYTVTVTRAAAGPSNNANLSNLVLSQGTLSPPFAAATTSYTASVPNSTTSVTVTPTAQDAGATITVNGTPVASGSPSNPIPLNVGNNPINVVVTAADGTTMKTYTVTVNRAAAGGGGCESAPHQAYVSNTTSGNQGYRGELGMQFFVTNSSGGITVKQLGAFDDGANGITGLQSGGVRVAIFNRNTHTIVSGLQVVITGNADHYTGNHRMKDITPVFLPPGDYAIVAKGYHPGEQNGNSGIGGLTYPTGDDGGGAILFGNQTSYGPDDPNGFNYPTTEADLGTAHRFLAGTFVFTASVPCGGPSNNANLSNLVLSQGTLTPPFTANTTSYTASVPNSTTSITVTPTAQDAGATITVNGTPVPSGSPSNPIPLVVGNNVINVVVTAADGTTTKTYTVTVTRAAAGGPSNNANLSNLVLSQGTLTPAFASNTTSYTASVPNSTTSITVTPTAQDAGATITVNGTPVGSGSSSNPISLVVGNNVINVVVTAADGTTTKTYTVTVTRAAAGGGGCETSPMQAYSANTNTGNQAWRGELGMEFIVNNPAGIIIKQLGAFDDGGNGITGLQSGGVRVAIFNRNTHTIVPGLNVVISGNGDHYTGNHRTVDISPVTLPPGDYVIVAKGYHSGEQNGSGAFPAGDNGGGAITFGSAVSYGPDDPNGFNYPVTEFVGNPHSFNAGTFIYTVGISCATLTRTTMEAETEKVSVQPKDLKIYPNPARARFDVQLYDVRASKITIQITDQNGKLVEQKAISLTGKTPSLTVPFNLHKQAAGIYFIKVSSPDGVKTSKIVLMH